MEWLQPVNNNYEKSILVAHKLTGALPAFAVLLGLAGLGGASGLFSGIGRLRPITAALLLAIDSAKVTKQGVPEDQQDKAIFAGDNLLRILAIIEGGLQLGLLKCSSPRLLQAISKLTFAATIVAFGLRALKAKRSMEGEERVETATHLLAMSAVLVGWTASSQGFAAFGKGLTIMGVGIELWLMRPKSKPPSSDEEGTELVEIEQGDGPPRTDQ